MISNKLGQTLCQQPRLHGEVKSIISYLVELLSGKNKIFKSTIYRDIIYSLLPIDYPTKPKTKTRIRYPSILGRKEKRRYYEPMFKT